MTWIFECEAELAAIEGLIGAAEAGVSKSGLVDVVLSPPTARAQASSP